MLETTNFIVYCMNGKEIAPMGFYDARDLAYRIGLLAKKDGKVKLQDSCPEPDENILLEAFAKSFTEGLEYYLSSRTQ